MKITENKDFLNAIRHDEGTSAEYRERVPDFKSNEEARQMERILSDYPTVKNEFINTLINKVVRTDFFSMVFTNPLKELKGGMLDYGTSIEQLFVQYAETKGFLESKKGETYDSAAALVSRKEAKIKTLYIERNFQYLYETSISSQQLKGAFLNQNGLSELVNQLIGSLTSGAELKEYKDIIMNLKAVANGKYLVTDTETQGKKGCLKEENIPSSKGIEQPMAVLELGENATGKKITGAVRALAGRMKFMSDKYNMAKVQTFSRKEDLVFLTTPEIVADIDVNVIAQAFNVSSADVNVKIIEVDELPSQFIKKGGSIGNEGDQGKQANCYGIVMDRKFIQAIDTVHEAGEFDNKRGLFTNMFLHRHGILATCYFCNCVALVDTLPTE